MIIIIIAKKIVIVIIIIIIIMIIIITIMVTVVIMMIIMIAELEQESYGFMRHSLISMLSIIIPFSTELKCLRDRSHLEYDFRRKM